MPSNEKQDPFAPRGCWVTERRLMQFELVTYIGGLFGGLFIGSTLPHEWLPSYACYAFAAICLVLIVAARLQRHYMTKTKPEVAE
jgi:hypothetical protein